MCTRTQSTSRTSLVKASATCVQDARIWYIKDVLVFETLRLIIEPMAGSVQPVGRHHIHARLPHRLVPPTCPPYQTTRSTYYSGTKHLPRGAQCQSVGHSGVQTHGKIEKSQLLELHPSTTGSTPRPRRRLAVFHS